MVDVLPEIVETRDPAVDAGGMIPSAPVERIVNVEPEVVD